MRPVSQRRISTEVGLFKELLKIARSGSLTLPARRLKEKELGEEVHGMRVVDSCWDHAHIT